MGLYQPKEKRHFCAVASCMQGNMISSGAKLSCGSHLTPPVPPTVCALCFHPVVFQYHQAQRKLQTTHSSFILPGGPKKQPELHCRNSVYLTVHKITTT